MFKEQIIAVLQNKLLQKIQAEERLSVGYFIMLGTQAEFLLQY
jgi:hypothetical protein